MWGLSTRLNQRTGVGALAPAQQLLLVKIFIKKAWKNEKAGGNEKVHNWRPREGKIEAKQKCCGDCTNFSTEKMGQGRWREGKTYPRWLNIFSLWSQSLAFVASSSTSATMRSEVSIRTAPQSPCLPSSSGNIVTVARAGGDSPMRVPRRCLTLIRPKSKLSADWWTGGRKTVAASREVNDVPEDLRGHFGGGFRGGLDSPLAKTHNITTHQLETVGVP